MSKPTRKRWSSGPIARVRWKAASTSDLLAGWLKGSYHFSLALLAPDKRARLERHAVLASLWDQLNAEQRRYAVEHHDAQHHPATLLAKQSAADGVRQGFKRVSVPRRQKLNAEKPRYSSRKVKDEDVLKAADGRTCAAAYRHMFEGSAKPPIKLRGFRYIWDRVVLKKKKGN